MQRNSSGDLEANRTALATSILRSSERVASAIANTINNNAITLSRPNLGTFVHIYTALICNKPMQYHVRTLDICTPFTIGHSAAIVVQQFSRNVHLKKRNGFGSSLGIHNPFHVFSLPLFNKTESLPVIRVPPSFLFAARGIKGDSGKVTIWMLLLSSRCF